MTTIAQLQIKVDATQVDQATQKLNNLAKATQTTAQAQEAASKAASNSSQATDKLLSSIDRETRSLKQLNEQQRQLKEARDTGSIGDNTFQKYNAIIQQNIALVKQRGTVVDQQNAKELAAAQKALIAEEKRQAAADKAAAKAEAAAEREITASQKRSRAILAAIEKERAAREKQAARDADKAEAQRYQETLQAMRALANEEKRLTKEKRDAAKATADEEKAYHNLLGSIDPVYAELKRLDAKMKALNSFKGRLSTAEFEQFRDKINAARQDAMRFKTNLNEVGLTSKQVQAAMRGLPAQFTDIVVSLQGGQDPLTVLLQQGGQIKDMFGGIKPALKAVGTGLVTATRGLISFINPATLAATAIAAIGIGAYQGIDEMQEFNKALILTGNYAGQTVNSLTGLSKSLANSTGASTAAAAEALTVIASTGKIASENLETVAKTALNLSRSTGQSIDETVKQFIELGNDPVKASEKLNESLHYLDIATYERIATLSQQGDKEAAAALATRTYADAMDTRSKKILQNLGWLEKGWLTLADAAKKGWNAILDVGRETDFETKLAKAEQALASAQTKLEQQQKYSLLPDFINSGQLKYLQDVVKARQDELNSIILTHDEETKKADAQAAYQRQQAAGIDADKRRLAILESQASQEEKIKKAVADAKKDIEDINAARAGVGQAPLSQKEQQAYIDAATKGASKKTGKSTFLNDTDVNDLKNKTAEVTSAYKKMYADIDKAQDSGKLSPQAAFQQRVDLLNKEKAALSSSYESQISEMEKLKGASSTTAAQRVSLDKRISDARTQMAKALTDVDVKLAKLEGNESKRVENQTKLIAEYEANAKQMVDNLALQGQRAREALGMSDSQAGLFGQLNAENDRYNNEQRDLNKARNQFGADQDAIDKQAKIAEQAHKEMTDQINSDYAKMKAAQADWSSGVTSAWGNFQDQAENVSGNVKQLFTGVFDGLTTTITDFVTTGKASFSDFAKSVLSDLAKILVRMALVNSMKAAFGGTAVGDFFGITQANGGAWQNGVQMFANGGAFTNSIVSSPTAFSSANGLGVMGEAGPEAIMPLTRTSSGALGVRAEIDSSATVPQSSGGGVQVYVQIDGSGNTSTSVSDTDYQSFGKDIGDFIDQRYQRLMTRDLSPGGQVWRSINGRL